MGKLVLFLILFGLFGYYVISYTCIYTTYLMYNILQPFEPEYRSKGMVGTEYRHFYININGYDLFLNPLRKYSDNYKVYESNENYISRINNWGYLYVPILDIFINKNGALR